MAYQYGGAYTVTIAKAEVLKALLGVAASSTGYNVDEAIVAEFDIVQ